MGEVALNNQGGNSSLNGPYYNSALKMLARAEPWRDYAWRPAGAWLLRFVFQR